MDLQVLSRDTNYQSFNNEENILQVFPSIDLGRLMYCLCITDIYIYSIIYIYIYIYNI